MKKTKPIIRILLGISLIMLITVLNQYFTDVMGTKHIITTCVGVLILFVLYLTKMVRRDSFITSLKDSLPYFTALFLFGIGGNITLAKIIFILVLILAISVLVIAIGLARRITLPIIKLADTSLTVASGDTNQQDHLLDILRHPARW